MCTLYLHDALPICYEFQKQPMSAIPHFRVREVQRQSSCPHSLRDRQPEFQLQEILAVDPEANEDTRIDAELRVLENAESLTSAASEIHSRSEERRVGKECTFTSITY